MLNFFFVLKVGFLICCCLAKTNQCIYDFHPESTSFTCVERHGMSRRSALKSRDYMFQYFCPEFEMNHLESLPDKLTSVCAKLLVFSNLNELSCFSITPNAPKSIFLCFSNVLNVNLRVEQGSVVLLSTFFPQNVFILSWLTRAGQRNKLASFILLVSHSFVFAHMLVIVCIHNIIFNAFSHVFSQRFKPAETNTCTF